MRYYLLLAAGISAPAPAQAPPSDLKVTIYNSDLALVQDTRRLSLPAGRSRQEFPNVSGRIRPETVTLGGADVAVVEQNFDFDLLSPSKLMEKAVGETITLVRTNPATGAEERERAKVLAVNGGVVLQIGERIEVLRDDGLPVRVIFDRVPENLRARPTLSVTLESGRGGARPVTLSYLTGGMRWKADYVALFDEPAGRIDVQGWVTLTNETGTTFDNADTLLVAGNVALQDEDGYGRRYPYRPPPPPPPPGNRPGTETAGRESLGGFYLYPLKERTTIANQQTKQVSFLDVSGAPGRRARVYRSPSLSSRDEAASVDSVLEFSSSRDQGLGDALPAGTIRVYQKDMRGNAQFVGEQSIGHTPMGSDVAIKTGEAFDVKVRTLVESRKRITVEEWRTTSRFRIFHRDGTTTAGERDNLTGQDFWRTTMRYTLTNARPQPVTVDLYQAGLDSPWRDTRIVSESLVSERLSADEVKWRVTVPANGETSVTATFDTRF